MGWHLFVLPKIGSDSSKNEEKRLLLVWGNISTPRMSCTGNSYAHSALRKHINWIKKIKKFKNTKQIFESVV